MKDWVAEESGHVGKIGLQRRAGELGMNRFLRRAGMLEDPVAEDRRGFGVSPNCGDVRKIGLLTRTG